MGKRKTIMLIVTYSCNLHCSYCYEPKNSTSRMTLYQAQSYIYRAISSLNEDYTELEVQFMGGEPLMAYSLIHDLSEWLWTTDFKISLSVLFAVTNGTLLNDEMKEWFKRNKHRICLGLSFDGDLAMQNVNRSNSASNIDLHFFATTWPEQSVKMTISPKTIGSLSNGVQYLHEVGFRNISAELAQGKFVKWDKSHLTELHQQLDNLVLYYLAHPGIVPFNMLQLDIDGLKNTDKNTKRCGCGEDMLCIDTDGVEYACHMFSPITTTRQNALLSNQIDFTNQSAFIPQQCMQCSLYGICSNCYGMGYSYYNDMLYVSPFICSSTKIKFFSACLLMLQHPNVDDISKKQITDILNQFK